MHPALPEPGPALDRTIRRNTITLAAGLAIAWTIIQLQAALTTITMGTLTGQTASAGVASALFLVTVGLVAIPAGRVMDRVGRGPILAGGFGLAAIAAATLFVVVSNASLAGFLIGMAVLGIGLGAASLARVGAADMAGPEHRGGLIGRVLLGAAVGAILGPIVFAPLLSGQAGDVTSLSTPWILAALIATLGAAVILTIRHDPLAIADALGLRDRTERASVGGTTPTADALAIPPRRRLLVIFQQSGLGTALGAVIVAQGVMAAAMSVVGLEMHHHGQDLGAISVALAVHIVDMFGLSPLAGRAVDRFGRSRSLFAGLIICAVGGAGLALGPTLATVLPSIFLVGAGWNLAYLAGSARTADATEPHERGASLAVLDMAGLTTSALMTLLGPATLSAFDIGPLMLVTAAVAAAAAVALVRGRSATASVAGGTP